MEINEHEYARLVQWAEQQRRHIAALEQENRELRRQVDDLRRGVGMAIVVQGRVIPVNPAPVDVPVPNAGPVPHPSFGPALQTAPQQPPQLPAQPPYAPQPQPTHQHVAPHIPPAPRPEVFSEELWITGQMRAVKAPVSTPAPRSVTPSQEMTPSWLREDAPQAPTPTPRRTLAAATSSHPAIPKPPAPAQPRQPYPTPNPTPTPPNPQQMGRQRVSARPLSRPSAPLPSLAQLTGQQPAVRVPGRQRQEPDERSPYSDSFVLG